MKEFRAILLGTLMLSVMGWFVGCSTDQPQQLNTADQPTAPGSGEEIIIDQLEVVLSDEEEGASVDAACCLRPIITCISSTDSSITIRICAGNTGAPGGFSLQWYPVPSGTACGNFVWPLSGVPTFRSTYPLEPYQCVTVTLRNINCETTYAFRGRAFNLYNCGSPFSETTCCTTLECEDEQNPPCPDEPTVECVSSTDSTIVVRICAGPTGAPAGVRVQYAEIAGGAACGSFVWPTTPASFTTFPLGPNACVQKTIRYLDCEDTLVFRAKALQCPPFTCPSDWTANVCCFTTDCPDEIPCPEPPVVTCYDATDSTIVIRISVGASGAAAGVQVQFAEIAGGVACDAFVWPTSNVSSFITTPLAPNTSVLKTIRNLDCEDTLVIRARVVQCLPFPCPSNWTDNVCCITGDCPDENPCPPAPPTVECVSETDSSLTIRLCAGATGAGAGVLVQYAELPAGTSCANFVWPSSGVAQFTSGVIAPNGCIEVTRNNLDCETQYVFRAQILPCIPLPCPSDWSANVCCTTADCPDQNPCPPAPPTVNCVSATDSTLRIQLCAGATGAGAGVLVQYAPLPAGTSCANFVWPSSGVAQFTSGVIGANGCIEVDIDDLDCETDYVFRAQILPCIPLPCPSDWSANVCCRTEDCPDQLPCVDAATVACFSETDTSLTVRVCAGLSGAPGGVLVEAAELPAGTNCNTFVWPSSGVVSTTTGALSPSTCVNVTFNDLGCETQYVFRVRALAGGEFNCPSDYSGNLCCVTAECPDDDLGCALTHGFWKNHPEDWPVTSLTIGTVLYTQTNLLFALNRSSAGGNALVILSRQLIAAKLNVAAGADDSQVATVIAQADALIGSLSITSGLVRTNTTLGAQMVALASILDQFNNGNLNVPHCPS